MEQKNLILAMTLAVAIMVGWGLYDRSRSPQQAPPPAEQTGTGADMVPAPSQTAPNAVVDVAPASAVGAGQTRDAALAQSPRVSILSPRLSGSINLRGARLDDLRLLDYRDTLEADSQTIELLSPAGGAAPYYAEFGWWTRNNDGPTRDTVWTADGSELTPDNPVTLSWTNPAGVVFHQTFALDKNYMFTVTRRVENTGAQGIELAPYGLIARIGTPKTQDFYILHEGPLGVFDGALQELDYDDLHDAAPIRQGSRGGWVGVSDKYWLTALIPDRDIDVTAGFSAKPRDGDYSYAADYLAPVQILSPGAKLEETARLFAGAKQTVLLDAYRDDLGIANFDRAVDFGIFYFLTKPLFYAIHWLNGFLGNFGLAILALTVIIKLLLFPLANKSYVSMSRMKLLQPQIQELKERCGDDRQKLSQAMMALYKKEKVNPMSGCLPILVQIPIFFSLYKVLFVTIEMRHAPFFGWIHDLSAPDPLGLLTLFGLLDWNVPVSLNIVNIGIWPILMGLTMWFQQKLNPPPADPIQAKIFAWLPIVFTFMLGSFPSGLVIYWAWNNLLSITQQWIILRRLGAARTKAA